MAVPKYAQSHTKKPHSVTRPIAGSGQVANSAGGYSFQIDDWKQLDRFLILGAEGGTYYIGEKKLIETNAEASLRCIKTDGIRAVNRAVEISAAGRAPKNDPAIFILALASTYGVPEVKKHAFKSIPKVCRIPTHLYHFAAFCDEMRGWGSGLKKAVSAWFTEQDPQVLAYQMVKYQQRDGWSGADLIRKAHPAPTSPEHEAIFRWMVGGIESLGARELTRERGGKGNLSQGQTRRSTTKSYKDVSASLPPIIRDFSTLNSSTKLRDVLPMIAKHNLPFEAIPDHLRTDPEMWTALLERGMPLTAMIRNLANMTRVGALGPLKANNRLVVEALGNETALKKARVHPILLLNAQRTYAAGQGVKGGNTWTPVQQIVDALDSAFYKAFEFVEPTGKNFLLALDVSASMTWNKCVGCEGITPREGSAAMSLVTAAVEKNYHIMGFSNSLVEINISPKMRLDQVIKTIERCPASSTNVGLPMQWALEQNVFVDTFCIYTDNETNCGMHPAQTLAEYRKKINPRARLVVIGMQVNNFSVADPKDAGQLDIVGFDTAAPQIIADFSRD